MFYSQIAVTLHKIFRQGVSKTCLCITSVYNNLVALCNIKGLPGFDQDTNSWDFKTCCNILSDADVLF